MNISPSQNQTFLYSPTPHKSHTSQEAVLSSNRETEEHVALAKLQKQDQEVRSHEQAHLRAAGGFARGGATFSFQRGPDGRQYAVGGEVSIDTSPVPGNPEATIRKAKQIRSAALAPTDPSAQDRAVAASASALEAQSQQELEKENQDALALTDRKTGTTFSQIDLFV